MVYSDKVKASRVMLDIIKSMKDEERIKVTYGIGFKGEPNVYTIHAYASKEGEMSYSIWNSFSGMNVASLGPTTIKCYTYDMMSQRTNYSFPLYEMLMEKWVRGAIDKSYGVLVGS
jgi:hypothetical protein